MKIKHKVIKEFQYLSPDKKIFILGVGTILEEYNYRVKTDIIPIDKDIVDNNPQFFEVIDWKAELLSYMKTNKLPQPAQLGKKIIPFIEEMILSSIGQQTGVKLDESKIRELEEKETELFSQEQNIQREKVSLGTRDRIIKDKEDDLEARIKRLEKRENDFKSELSLFDKKEEELRERNRELIDKQLDLDDKLQDLNEKERNLDLTALKSSEQIDAKYTELQTKMDNDLKLLSNKEKELESKLKELSKRESEILKREEEISDKIKEIEEFDSIKNEFDLYKEEVFKLDQEIKEWEGRNMKMRRLNPPPSAIL
jgi:hypothetical protein